MHILRHSAASRMLNFGVPMKQIADILRHRSIDTSVDDGREPLINDDKELKRWREQRRSPARSSTSAVAGDRLCGAARVAAAMLAGFASCSSWTMFGSPRELRLIPCSMSS
ncbi:MAG: hypothetical protein EOR68_33520 [Mesorhizobium sp.]|nr:hypothetical protein [Mesorhizobium sp.]RWL87116.1 MAG: hypothetical protein EOR68_33520 [Mesorhizobium sp.]TIP41444.1 MAG: hypothetical protein E5X77_26010 [Mesorhizobium sp.]TJV67784.1 MAG: hypothetical protein E5X76_32470 [Mesorhizobium sp.]